MAAWVFQPDNAFAQAHDIVGDDEQGGVVVAIRLVVGRHEIGGIMGEQSEPVVELPTIEQVGFMKQEVFHFQAQRTHTGVSINSFQRRQNVRIWPSSVSSWSSSLLYMPRDRSFHGASRQAA